MRKLCVLVKIDGYDYVWCFGQAKRHLNNYCKREGVTKVKFYDMIADECFVSAEAIKNWFTEKNGPSEIESVRMIARHFGIDYMDLLISYEKMKDDLIESLSDGSDPVDVTLNYPTVRFISMLNELAEMTRQGYCKFSELRPDDDHSQVVYIDEEGPDKGKIVMDMCVGEDHHDVISTYDYYVIEATYDARVVTIEDEIFIEITTTQGNIVVDDGRWYCC